MWYAGVLAAAFLLCGGAAYQLLRHYLKQSLEGLLQRRIEQISISLLANVERTGEPFVAEQIKTRYAPENFDRFIRLTRSDGSVLYASGRAANFNPAGLSPARPEDSTRVELLPDGNRLLVASKVYRSASAGNTSSKAPAPCSRRFGAGAGAGVAESRPAGGVVGGGWRRIPSGGARAGAGRGNGPQRERITLHNLNERLPLARTGDELEQLSLALNRMIARLGEAFEQNRRFLADASHESRTPLTALRGELESVLEQTREPQVRDRIGSALEEVDRLAKIVETLFAISRLDAGEAQQERTRLDLARLAAGVADQMTLLAEDKGVAVQCRAGEKVFVEGDSARLKQVVVNLLDNAIKDSRRRHRHAGCSPARRPGGGGSGGHRHRHSGDGPAPRFRAIFPGGQGAFARRRRSGPGSGHRQVDLHRARRASESPKRRRPRQHVHRGVAAGRALRVHLAVF